MIVDNRTWEELTPLERAQSIYWDMYKDAYGIRPRGINTDGWTLEEFEVEFKRLGAVIEADMNQEAIAQAVAIKEVEEQLALWTVAAGGDRAAALRWIHDAEETNGDNEYLCYKLGLPYGYFNENGVKNG